ncbi:MAG: hypothetical protein C0478_05950 [Planctomyces sp.]|nr:hypothetical protein [Planctomyces sp.]
MPLFARPLQGSIPPLIFPLWLGLVLGLQLSRISFAVDESPAKLQFNSDVRPILSDRCFHCHGPDSATRAAELRLDQREAAVGAKAINLGNLSQSEILARITSDDPELVMPPPALKKPLTAIQKATLKTWIEQGAEYQPHWSFIPVPKSVAVPSVAVRKEAAPQHPIDIFIDAKLREAGWQASPTAPREAWLRRVTFDLTGLPPTAQELQDFLAQPETPELRRALVDRLFQTPAYAERMTNDWLDLARYADTFGYQADRDMHMWPWRDWVLRAFARNMSYKDFLTWQVAGDLLPPASRPEAAQDQRLATAFNRLHRQTNEGGSVEEEFRVEYVSDRVRTIGTAALGLTMECCRCHDHKYDPISQKEFYALSAFFANVDEHGLYSHFTETAPTPTLLLFADGQQAQHEALLASVREAEANLVAVESQLRSSATPTPPGNSTPLTLPAPIGQFDFEGVNPGGTNKLAEGHAPDGYKDPGQAIEFSGDDEYKLKDVGNFARTSPFSISMWLRPAEHKGRMVVAHCSQAAEDSAFRGYALTLDEGRPTFSLVHFWPGNAIRVQAADVLPLEKWSHLTVTYDGSSRAAGVQVYLDGRPLSLAVHRDRLTRDIRHRGEWGDSAAGGLSLSLGARFRDIGFSKGRIDDLSVYNLALSAAEVAQLAALSPEAATTATAGRPPLHWLRPQPAWQAAAEKLAAARVAEDDFITKIRQIMVMDELAVRRPTHLLKRGEYLQPAEEVLPDVPQAVALFRAEWPRNRLGLSQWLVDDSNPLTARVAVNRLWQITFGRGLVATPEDYGSQGALPTHPELLDWLARDFMDHGWDIQHTLRQIVLSEAYARSATPADAAYYQADPENRLMARGPKFRLPAEMLRDQALATSGLLVAKVGGPSVYPYQPAGLWEEAGTGKSYPKAGGEHLYRRSMYTFWRRIMPPPTMSTFDAPSRESCVAKRERTSTPLQALVLLNDPQFVEAAKVYAEKLILAHPSPQARIQEAFTTLLTRSPSAKELELLESLLSQQTTDYQSHPAAAAELLKVGEKPPTGHAPPEQHAALTQTILLLFSHDDCVSR